MEELFPRTSDIIINNNTIAPTTQSQGELYQVVVVVVVEEVDEFPPPEEAGAPLSCEKHNNVIKFRKRKQLHAFHPFGISNRFMVF